MMEGMDVLALSRWWSRFLGYEIVDGNAVWRILLMLGMVAVTLVAGRVVQRIITLYAGRLAMRMGESYATIAIRCMANPAYVATFAVGVLCAKLPLRLSEEINEDWITMAQSIGAIALMYAVYQLVDVVEFALQRLAQRTETRLDDMFVPVIQKTLKIVIVIIAVLLVSERLLGQDTVNLLLWVAMWVAIVGGIAIALAAKDPIADFFGSMTIFADQPFETGHLVKINDYTGEVEDVGFRCTRLRTLDGHRVSIPNRRVAESAVEDISTRPFIRRVTHVILSGDSGHQKAALSVEIIKDILSGIPDVNAVPDQPPRAYLSDFKEGALDILVIYVVKPADVWLFHEINERVNIEILKRFQRESIVFARPTENVHIKKELP